MLFVLYSIFNGGLERCEKKFYIKPFFFRFSWCLLSDGLLLLTTLIVVASASAVHSNFKDYLKDFLKTINHFLFKWFQLKDCWLSCHSTEFSCAVNNFHKIISFLFNLCLLKDCRLCFLVADSKLKCLTCLPGMNFYRSI